ncbi:hypothetical protein D3C72_114170 [compost metagenome]
MKRTLYRNLESILLATLIAGSASTALAQTAAKRGVNLPPSAELSYAINANQRGLALNGTAILHWSTDKSTYSITSETRAMLLGKILEAKSEGVVDASGLAPLTSTEKRYRKDPTTVTFNRETKTISFSASEASYPIKGGEQDRNSVVWQLATIARSTPNKFKTGASIPLTVVGQKDAEAWTFKVKKAEKIKTSTGELNTVKVSRVVTDGGKDQQLDIWFAPSMEWYPARVRITEPEGDFIEQTLNKVTPQ